MIVQARTRDHFNTYCATGVAAAAAHLCTASFCTGLQIGSHSSTTGHEAWTTFDIRIDQIYAVQLGAGSEPCPSPAGPRRLYSNLHLIPSPRQGGGAELPESFAVLGFAFYLQPCLLPLLAEMPPGAAGVRLMTAATRTVIMGVATVVGAREGVIGFFPGLLWVSG